MTIKFFIVKGKSQISSIYVRMVNGHIIDRKTKTGLTVKQNEWNEKKGVVKNTVLATHKDFVNNKLKNLELYLFNQFNIDYNSEVHIGKNWLKEQVNNFFGRVDKNELHKTYFIDWVQKFIDDCPNNTYRGNPIKNRTIQHYKTTKFKLENYEKYFDTKLRFQDIGLAFHQNFIFYCKNIERINNNTIGGYITNIKKWCKLIDIDGLPINQQYRSSSFSAISNKTKDVYLTEEEIDLVYNHDFSKSERLDNVRDNFIIGLWTGLRISDFLQLKEINLINDFIEIETSKTEHPVVIPMHEQVKKILLKRSGKLPNQITDQKFNKYVKEVCQLVGFTEKVEGAKMINKKDDKDFFPNAELISKNKSRKEFGTYPKHELISSHTCRRSFASNLYGKLPNMTIMAITAHTTETQFLKYIKITPRENAEKLKLYWEQQKK